MRKILRIVVIFTLIILSLSFVGCSKGAFSNEHKWLYEKMSEIPIEHEGYYFENVYGTDEAKNEFVSEYTFRGEELVVELFDNGGYNIWMKIHYDGNEIAVDNNFMEERSQTFHYINHIWDEKLENNSQATYISDISVFDDKIFISTCGLRLQKSASAKRVTPIVLYYYDWDSDKIYYCGFYAGEISERGYYDGFTITKHKCLIIKKK